MRLRSTFLGLATLLSAVTSAFAGAGEITTTVTPLQAAVTYSTSGPPALVTYVGYTVTVANVGGNTVNHIRFTGTTSVTDADEAALFDSVEGAACTVSNGGRSIDCAIGQLSAGASFPTFAVFFRAPIKDMVSPTPDGVAGQCGTTDCVAFGGRTWYAEGTGGPTSPPQNSFRDWTTSSVTLGTFNPTLVRSAVPRAGGTFFTGAGGVSRGGDPFASLVTVPPAALYSTAVIDESTFTDNCNNFIECWQSDITVTGNVTSEYPPYLTIVLRQDASNIVKGTKIESVTIRYQPTPADPAVDVGPCANATTPLGNGLPCIAERKHYKNRNVQGWTRDLDGDFEWVLISLKNGRFGIQ